MHEGARTCGLLQESVLEGERRMHSCGKNASGLELLPTDEDLLLGVISFSMQLLHELQEHVQVRIETVHAFKIVERRNTQQQEELFATS